MKEDTQEVLTAISESLDGVDGHIGEVETRVDEISTAQAELSEKVEKIITEGDRRYDYLHEENSQTRSRLYKADNEIYKRPTFANSFWIAMGAIALVAFIVFICWAGIYAPIHDSAYKEGYIKGHNEVIEKLLPEPDRQTWEQQHGNVR